MENPHHAPLTDDQLFLLSFIMGTYFGPDLKNEKRHKSVLQIYSEGLLLYNKDDLADSQIMILSMESVYYYILRNAETSAAVNQHLLVQFIHGMLPPPIEGTSGRYLSFSELFPSALHQCFQNANRCDTIESIAFVNNPEIYYITPTDIARFKSLTRLEDFRLDWESAMRHIFVEDRDLYNVKVETILHFDPLTSTRLNGNFLSNWAINFSDSLQNACPVWSGPVVTSALGGASSEGFYPGTLFLPSCPSSTEEWCKIAGSIKCGFAVTGSASRHIGPVLGLMDVGESEDSYLFRVSLPGVKRDEREFSCEVESNGTVLIKGVTVTGERTLERFSQIFEMQTQNLCAPGPFSISFKLPGPVDPQQFHGTFASDGILEGIALKTMRTGF